MCDLSASLSPASHGVPGWKCLQGYPAVPICNGTISTWAGVNCSNGGDIINIYLRYRGLTGTIPSSIGNIGSLTFFSLGYNSIDGRIPSQVGLLTNLVYLGLSGNMLSGSLPSSIGRLTRLTQFYVFQNSLNGTLPQEIGKMISLYAVIAAHNKFSGTIPSSIVKIPYLRIFLIGNNSLTGTIPTFFGSMKRLIMLALSGNQYRGTIPHELSLSPNLQVLTLNNNYLTGTIPSSFPMISTLQNLCLSGNQLTGKIPDSIDLLSNLMYLLIDGNLLTGTIPSSLTNMQMLQLLDLSHNSLRGSIPKFKNAQYQFVRLNNNQLRGSLELIFSDMLTLKFLDVSNNQLSGMLPTDIFTIPNLQVFAAAGNCFYKSLPVEICLANSLSVLALDGMHASPYCDSKTLYYLYGAFAEIPPCLFSMSSLEVLHLSGNDLSGTLPDMKLLSPTLVDLTLSHNLLRGTIPSGIQHSVRNTLDLSFNKLGGTITDGLPIESNNSLSLMINRLSGYVPSSLDSATNISILKGNVFACDFDTRLLPSRDPEASSYSCGSDQLQLSFYLWASVPLTIILSMSYLLLRHGIQCEALFSLFGELWSAVASKNNSTNVFHAITELRSLCVTILLPLVFFLIPVYVALGYYYSSHTYRYAWMVSAAFLSGIAPAIVILVLWLLTVFFVYAQLKKNHFAQNLVVPEVYARGGGCKHWCRVGCCSRSAVLGLIVQLSINIIFVLPINAVYVYSSLSVNTAEKLLLQLLLGLFKLAWGGIFVKNIGRLQRLITANEDNSLFSNTTTTTVILISNAIVIPIIAQAAVDPSCFFAILFPSPPVSVSYSYGQICWGVFMGMCSYIQVDLFTTYSPQFTYSYQCSSALLVNYSSVFVYMFLVIFLWAIIKLTLSKLGDNFPSCFRWIIYMDASTGESTFNLPVYLSTCMCYVVILLTFGVTYPPLGVVICVTVAVDTVVTQHIVKSSFEEEVGSIQTMAVVFIYVVPAFYAGFLFDMVGDESGAVGALWAPILMLCVPLCYVVGDRIMCLYCVNNKENTIRNVLETPSTDHTPQFHEDITDDSFAIETMAAVHCQL